MGMASGIEDTRGSTSSAVLGAAGLRSGLLIGWQEGEGGRGSPLWGDVQEGLPKEPRRPGDPEGNKGAPRTVVSLGTWEAVSPVFPVT